MHAAGKNLGRARNNAFPREPNLSHLNKPLGKIGQDFGGYLTTSAPRTHNTRKG
jgi:hypothetical protein